ncbi:hypothetical protein U1Q18_025618, partial [Sarracenia purpurea var. burkii]
HNMKRQDEHKVIYDKKSDGKNREDKRWEIIESFRDQHKYNRITVQTQPSAAEPWDSLQ